MSGEQHCCGNCRYEAIDQGSEIECGSAWCDYRKQDRPLLEKGACEHYKVRPLPLMQGLYVLRDARISWSDVLCDPHPIAVVENAMKEAEYGWDEARHETARLIVKTIRDYGKSEIAP